MQILGKTPLDFETPATILREFTLFAEYFGLRFHLSGEQRSALEQAILAEGFLPTEHVRKYPRIPVMSAISTFPLRVTAVPAGQQNLFEAPLVFDVKNLSPNGVLLSTESQIALVLAPGQRLNLTLEPRGSFPLQVQVEGLICRVTDDLDPESRNLTRYLGIKFTRVDEVNRAVFLDLLKDILEKLKTIRGEE